MLRTKQENEVHTFKESCLCFFLSKVKDQFNEADFYGAILLLPIWILVALIAIPISIVFDFAMAIIKAT